MRNDAGVDTGDGRAGLRKKKKPLDFRAPKCYNHPVKSKDGEEYPSRPGKRRIPRLKGSDGGKTAKTAPEPRPQTASSAGVRVAGRPRYRTEERKIKVEPCDKHPWAERSEPEGFLLF